MRFIAIKESNFSKMSQIIEKQVVSSLIFRKKAVAKIQKKQSVLPKPWYANFLRFVQHFAF